MLPHSAGQFMAVMVLTCTLGLAGTPVIFAQLVTRWFHKRRGLALSAVFASSSLGIAF